jgi:hypothetical protein
MRVSPLVVCALLLALASASAHAAVFAGRVVSTASSFYDSDETVTVLLRVPQVVIARGVCVDLIPIESRFDATTLTNCTVTLAAMPFVVPKPGVYYVQLRMRTEGTGIDVWGQRAVVITVLTGNLSMARAMIGVMVTMALMLAALVFLWVPLKLIPLPPRPGH